MKIFFFSLFLLIFFINPTYAATAGPGPDPIFSELPKGVREAFNHKNYRTVMKLCRPLAEQGDPAAETMVAWLYRDGLGVKRNYKEAVKWYGKAAEQNYSRAQQNLSHLYYDGLGVDQDRQNACFWWILALDTDTHMMCDVHLTRQEIKEVQQRVKDWRALRPELLLQDKAERGDADAQYSLGIKYFSGDGVPQNFDTAEKWFRKARGNGKLGASSYLARLYVGGNSADQKVAFKLFEEAANAGDTGSQFQLGHMYWHGKGAPQSDVEAYFWMYLSSIAQKNRQVSQQKQDIRNVVRAKLSPEEVQSIQKRAAEWRPTLPPTAGK